jgi:DNA-binding XRE family transcriptional regulator
MFPAPAVFALYAEQLFGELGSRHCRCHDRVACLSATRRSRQTRYSAPRSRHQLKAARALVGLQQRTVAQKANIDVTTLVRMERSGAKTVRGYAGNVEAVIEVLRKAGVKITDNGVELIKPRR